MPLWYDIGQGGQMRKISLARGDMGIDAYICGSGPSLRKVNPFDLQVPGVLVVGLNNSYPYIKPNIWFGVDDPHCYSRKIYWEPFMKIMRGGYQNRTCDGVEIKECPNIFYADCEWIDQKKGDDPESYTSKIFERKDDEAIFIWNASVTGIALHVLVWMGVKNIYLLGSDLSTEGGDYHYKENLSKKNKEYAQKAHDRINDFYKIFCKESPKHGVNLRSCTPDSRINDYMEYVPLNEALAKSEKRVLPEGKLFFGAEVERERKNKKNTDREGEWHRRIQDKLKNLEDK